MKQNSRSTVQYYDNHAREYVSRTERLDLSSLYQKFLSAVRPKGIILDVGCGSGRDLKVFQERGFTAIGIDASRALVDIAQQYSEAECLVRGFDEIDWHSCFDGVWACASLLHAPKTDIVDILQRLREALRPGGVMYVSLRQGTGERVLADGRYFADYSASEFREKIAEAKGLEVLDSWTTSDASPDRQDIRWLNFLLRKG